MIKLIGSSYYSILCNWWQSHGWPAIPKELLSSRGYISCLNEKPIIAGFLYKDETSTFGMMEWIIANPESTQEERTVAFKELVDHVVEEAGKIGVKFMFTVVKSDSLKNRFLENGFNITETQMTHLGRRI